MARLQHGRGCLARRLRSLLMMSANPVCSAQRSMAVLVLEAGDVGANIWTAGQTATVTMGVVIDRGLKRQCLTFTDRR